MLFPIRLDQYIGKMQKLSKKECSRVVVGPFSFITNSSIYQIHIHQIKVPEKMLMLAWILHEKIRKKLVHWRIIFSNWLLMTWYHFLVLEVFFLGCAHGLLPLKRLKVPEKWALSSSTFFWIFGACFQPSFFKKNMTIFFMVPLLGIRSRAVPIPRWTSTCLT